MNVFLEWSVFKTKAIHKTQVRYESHPGFYKIHYRDDFGNFETTIADSETADIAEFVTYWAPYANSPAIGKNPFSDPSGFRARFKGINGTVPFGTIANIDHTLTAERWIDGVELLVKDANCGDTAKLQIVHPTAGIVDEFGSTWNIDSASGKQNPVVLSYPAKLAAGLTIRTEYNSTGTADVWVGVNLRLHMKT